MPAAISVRYRADRPVSLVAAQEKAWSPVLAFARQALGARFVLAEGVVHVAQNPEALAAVERAVAQFDPLALAALHTVTTLTGSALIALALAHGADNRRGSLGGRPCRRRLANEGVGAGRPRARATRCPLEGDGGGGAGAAGRA